LSLVAFFVVISTPTAHIRTILTIVRSNNVPTRFSTPKLEA
jgi:hypothetical protein